MSNDKTNEFLDQALCLRAVASPDKIAANFAQMSQAEVLKVMHEFQVHLSELELQIRELQKPRLQMKDSLDHYKNVYDCAPIGFLTLNSQGYIANVNNAVCELLDLSETQLLDTKLTKYIVAEENSQFHLFFKQLVNSTDRQRIEFKVKRSNMGICTVACHGCHSNTNDDKNEVLLMLQDISDRKKVEQAIHQLNEQLKLKINAQNEELFFKNEKLQDSIKEISYSRQQLSIREAKLISIFNAAIDGIVTIDDQGMIESANKAITAIFGYQADELIGHNVSKLMPERIRKHHGSFIQNYLVSHQSQTIGVTKQVEGQKKDGTLTPIDLSVSEYKIDDRSYFIGMIKDISERKNKEIEDKQHLDQLAHVTRLGLMGEMAAGIAHEVNQPLTAIATYSQVCLRMLNTADFDLVKLQETLEKTEKQACRAGRIIARMREFISSKRLHRSSVDIHELIKNAMDLASDECQQFSIECCLDLIGSPPYISVDEIQIEQVLLNLIKNSIDSLIKLSPEKHRKLSVQTYLNESRQIETRVKDNGEGIKIKEQAKIFSPFFTTKVAGMGMGLSICQSLITSHGGQIRFNSIEGKGTTFYFTLPIIET
jgi:PAS domain S-box-containing protein